MPPRLAGWWRLFGSGQLLSGLLPIPREKDLQRLRSLLGCTPFLGMRALFYARLIRRLLNPEFLRFFSPLAALASVGQELRSADVGELTPTNMDRLLAIKYDLPSYILSYLADREEMAHSIEGRVPFLDDSIVAFASALPDAALIGEASGKQLIRLAFADRLPPRALASRKRIFLAPPSAVDDILRSEWADHMLARPVSDAVGVFDWRKLAWLRAGVRIVPAYSGAGIAMRAMLIFVISLHALHELFIVGRSRS
jgi:asparagine synthase (glutamine-hydrolysing)